MSALEKLRNIVNSLQNIALTPEDKEIMIREINSNIIEKDQFYTDFLKAKDRLTQDVTNFKEKEIEKIRQEFLYQNIDLRYENTELKLQNNKLKFQNDKLKSEYINLKFENTNYLTLLQQFYGKDLENLIREKNERKNSER